MADGRYCSVRAVKRRGVTSMAGNGTAYRDGRTESGVSAGDAALAPDCATLQKAAICGPADYSALSEAYPAPSLGFLTCSPRLKKAAEAGICEDEA